MAASNPAGEQKFWFNGIPVTGVQKPGTDPAGLKYWFNGVPYDTLFPATTQQQYAAFSVPQHSLSQVVQRMIGY